MKPDECKICLKGTEACKTPGDFGDHTKGIYLNLQPDTSFLSQHRRKPEHEDAGAIIMFRFFSGRCKLILETRHKLQPTENYQSHEHAFGTQYYIFDKEQIMPRYILHWKAVRKIKKH